MSLAAHLGEQRAPWSQMNEDETVHEVSFCTCQPVSPLRKHIETIILSRFRAKRTKAAETLLTELAAQGCGSSVELRTSISNWRSAVGLSAAIVPYVVDSYVFGL